MTNRRFQVALSFAGEQRDYVEKVARHLSKKSISVFYDGYEKTWLWGRDGLEIFEKVFETMSSFVVMFISSEYMEKRWPTYERQVALGRASREKTEYVLPVRFDDTPVPGLPESILYLKASNCTPAELATTIAEKIGVSPYAEKASDIPPPRMTSQVGEVVFDYSNFNGRYTIGSGNAKFETQWSKASNARIHIYNDPDSICGVALAKNATFIHEVSKAKELDYTSRVRTPQLNQIIILRNTCGFYAALQILDIKDDTRGHDSDELRFRYAIEIEGSGNFQHYRHKF